MRNFIQLYSGEYFDTSMLIKFGVEQQIERSIIWSEDNQGKRHTIDVIDIEWIDRWEEWMNKQYDNPSIEKSNPSSFYYYIAKNELKRIMTDLLDYNII